MILPPHPPAAHRARSLAVTCWLLLGLVRVSGAATAPPLSSDRPIESITVTGLRHSRPDVILRELSCREGDRPDWNRLERDRLRILDLGPFAEVSMQSAVDSLRNLTVLFVKVRERPTILVYPILNYSREDGVTYGARAIDHNFRGLNQAAEVSMISGGRRGGALSFATPWIAGRRLGAGVDLRTERFTNHLQEQEERHEGISFFVRPTAGPETSFPFEAGSERVSERSPVVAADSSHPATGGWQRHLWVREGYWHDSRDLRARPRRGSVFGLFFTAHGGILGGDTSFEQYELDLLRVIARGRQGAVTAASRLLLSRGRVPDYLRVGLGGAATLRGCAEGAYDGDSRWYGWCERRFPLLPEHTFSFWHGRYAVDLTLDGAFFVDGGAIWSGNALEQGRARARWGAGTGLRLTAPFFRLLSLDVATDGRKVRFSGMGGLRL